jgi:hypothetical protein
LSYVHDVETSSNPVIGMTFDGIEDVQKFYKDYARDAGFSIRISQQKKGNEETLAKYFYCSREGYIKERGTQVVDQSGKGRHIMCWKPGVGVRHIFMSSSVVTRSTG